MDDGPVRYYHYDRGARKATFLFTNRPALEELPLARMHPTVIDTRDGMKMVSYYTLPVWSAEKGWHGPAPSKEEEAAMAKRLGLPPTPDAIYQRLGTGGVNFPALIQVLRDRHYDGWISLDFNYADMPPGVTIEQDMGAHRTYLVETLRASLKT